jgi:SAM-dependent methyltransferase
MTTDRQRARVIARYSGLARQAMAGQMSTDPCFDHRRYTDEEAVPDGPLRASLGCGNPVAVAGITPGETVLDLGSGGGLDVILSARRTGPTGKAYGLDASPDMLTLARTNAEEAGAGNVEFLHGHIEDIPLPDGHVDVVISNCVINLSADKPRVLHEAFRVLRPGGRLGVADIIGRTSDRTAAEPEVGCVSGTLTGDEYRDRLLATGFTTIEVTPTHEVAPGLSSVIVKAVKPS